MQPKDIDVLDGEIFVDIKGYEGLYMISNFGRVYAYPKHWESGRAKSKKKSLPGRIKKTRINIGYAVVMLCKNGIKKTYKVHRLMAIAFIPNPQGFKEINHIDQNRSNNNIKNLEWCNCQQNAISSVRSPTNRKQITKEEAEFIFTHINDYPIQYFAKKFNHDGESIRKLVLGHTHKDWFNKFSGRSND